MADGQQPIPIPPSGQPLVDPNDFVYQVSTAPQVNDQNVVPSDVTGSLPTLTPQVPPAWMPAQNVLANPELHAAAVHHARLASSIGNAVSEMMSGGEGQQLHILRRPDGSYMVQAQPMTQGQRWARVAAAALSGATQGFAVGQGPGGAGRAAAAGLQAGMQIGQGNQDQTLNLAERMNKQDRDAQLFKANMTLLNQHAVQGAFNLHQSQIKATEDEQDRQDRIRQSMTAAHADHLFIPSDGSPTTLMDRVAQQINSNPDLAKAHADGRTSVFTRFGSDGQPTGVDVYNVPVDKMTQLNAEPYERHVTRLNADGTKLVDQNLGTIDAGSMEHGKLMAMMQADAVQDTKTKLDFQKIEGDIAQRKLELESQRIAASLAKQGASGTWELGETKDGDPIMYNNKTAAVMAAPQGILRQGTRAKLDAATAKVMEPINDALAYANNYGTNPRPTGSGDEALMEKFFDLAKPSSGFRMSQPQIDMLKNSQDLMGSTEAKLRHLTTGTWFSTQQRQDIIRTMNDIAQSKVAGHLQTVGGGGAPTPTANTLPTPTPTPPTPGQTPPATNPPTQYTPQSTYDPRRTYTVISGGKTFNIPGANMGKAWAQNPNLQVTGER